MMVGERTSQGSFCLERLTCLDSAMVGGVSLVAVVVTVVSLLLAVGMAFI
jgi:hypothetical protein